MAQYNREELFHILKYLISYLEYTDSCKNAENIAGYKILNMCKHQLDMQVQIGQIAPESEKFILSLIGWQPDKVKVNLNKVLDDLRSMCIIVMRSLNVFILSKDILEAYYKHNEINKNVYMHALKLVEVTQRPKEKVTVTIPRGKTTLKNRNSNTKSQLKNNKTMTVAEWIDSDAQRFIKRENIPMLDKWLNYNKDFTIEVRNSQAVCSSDKYSFDCKVDELLTNKGTYVRRELVSNSPFVVGVIMVDTSNPCNYRRYFVTDDIKTNELYKILRSVGIIA